VIGERGVERVLQLLRLDVQPLGDVVQKRLPAVGRAGSRRARAARHRIGNSSRTGCDRESRGRPGELPLQSSVHARHLSTASSEQPESCPRKL
jgi:hypothetical protein